MGKNNGKKANVKRTTKQSRTAPVENRCFARAGRCYELAYQHIVGMHEGTLIHADVFSPELGYMIGHALVETETGYIYEPVLDRYLEKDWLYHTYKVEELARYTVEEAITMACKTGNYGPW